MKVYIVIAFIIIAFAPSLLSADPLFMLMEAGYAPASDYVYIGAGIPIAYLSPIKSGSLVTKVFYKDVGGVQGFETASEPYSWWVPTGEEIWSGVTTNIGYMFDVPGTSFLALTPYIGFGSKYTYTQYISSATNIGFYNRTKESYIDAGLDATMHSRYFGVVTGFTLKHGVYMAIHLRL